MGLAWFQVKCGWKIQRDLRDRLWGSGRGGIAQRVLSCPEIMMGMLARVVIARRLQCFLWVRILLLVLQEQLIYSWNPYETEFCQWHTSATAQEQE